MERTGIRYCDGVAPVCRKPPPPGLSLAAGQSPVVERATVPAFVATLDDSTLACFVFGLESLLAQ